MMDYFVVFKQKLQEHFNEMQKNATHLFEVNVDKDELWNTYLDSFPEGTNKIFRERREHDCSCCRQFIKAIGAVVMIKDMKMHTIWEVNTGDTMYQTVCDALDAFVKSHAVKDVFLSPFKKIGTDYNYELIGGKSHKWDHFYLELPDRFVNKYSISETKCQTAHCGRGKSHFIFGGLASPIVPYRNLTQTTDGITADCRSLV